MPWNNAEKCLKNIYILLPYLFLNFTTKVYLLITEYEIKKYQKVSTKKKCFYVEFYIEFRDKFKRAISYDRIKNFYDI